MTTLLKGKKYLVHISCERYCASCGVPIMPNSEAIKYRNPANIDHSKNYTGHVAEWYHVECWAKKAQRKALSANQD